MSQLVLYDFATIVSQLLRGAPDGRDYRISTMYVEFANGISGTISAPTITDRSLGLAYYNGLSSSLDRDYLRVPIIRTGLESTDEALYPSPGGNLPVFAAHIAAGTGVHGKAFNSTQQSRVYGAALVATPDPDDPALDLVAARIYYTTLARQLAIPASTGITIDARIQLP